MRYKTQKINLDRAIRINSIRGLAKASGINRNRLYRLASGETPLTIYEAYDLQDCTNIDFTSRAFITASRKESQQVDVSDLV